LNGRPLKTHKTCKACQQTLPRDAFSVHQPKRGGSPQIAQRCKKCDYIQHRAFSRWKKTGFTQEQYDTQFAAQGGVCAICHEKSEKQLSADHDHATNAKRGLLCQRCNTVLGFVKDNITLLQSSIDYLNRYKS
jgi:hypothetical protein